MTTASATDRAALVRAIAAQHLAERGPLMPVLHEVLEELGHVAREDVEAIADVLNLSVAEVHGVVSFYHDFRTEPPAAPRGRAVPGRGLPVGRGRGPVRRDARPAGDLGDDVEVDEVFCLGNCALGPSGTLDGRLHGRLSRERLDALTEGWRVTAGSSCPATPRRCRSAPTRSPPPSRRPARTSSATAPAACSGSSRWSRSRPTRAGVGYANVDARRRRRPSSPASADDIGVVDEHPWLTSQRAGQLRAGRRRRPVVDRRLRGPRRLGRAAPGAVTLTPAEVVQEVTDSGLRGRGGAGFPAGIKWKTVLETASDLKFVACNFDEGDSGTFADRMVVEGDPFTLIEGMTIAAHAVGASEGYVYVRSEYPHAIAALRRAVEAAYTHGYLGADVLGSGLAFDLHVRVGAGAYICGEESSMLESLEGRRGEVRAKPPIPAIKGLWGRPTAVNNVLTLCAVPMVLADGGAAYAALGTGRSRGTQVFQLAGNIKQGGIVELPFGVSLRELVEEYGGGTLPGRPVRAAQVGGPLGAYVPPTGFDVAMDYEALAESGAMLGHGGIVVFDDTVDMARMARFAMEFCSIESCGKCTPCRVGSTRGVETIDRIIAGQRRRGQPGAPRRPLRDDDEGVAVRDGRADPDARAERDQALARGLRAGAGAAGSTRMT